MFTREDKIIIKHYRLEKSYGSWKLLKEFPNKGWSRSGLDYLLSKIDKTGSIERKIRTDDEKSVRTEENVQKVKKLILSQEGKPGSHKSIRQIAKSIPSLSKSSVHRIVHKDLKLKPFKKITGQKLTKGVIEKRMQRSRKLLRRLTVSNVQVTFFSDEKIFTIETPIKKQNDRVYGCSTSKKNEISDERLFATKSHFPSSVMISVGISKLGKTSVHFIERNVKINGEYYRNNLLSKMIPEMNALAKNGHYVFQQDGAKAHTANASVAYLKERVPELIEPEIWPPNSPDLNPLDYRIWSSLSQKVYENHNINNVNELKEAILVEWSNFPQFEIDNAIDEFRKRVKKCIENKGLHVEQFF